MSSARSGCGMWSARCLKSSAGIKRGCGFPGSYSTCGFCTMHHFRCRCVWEDIFWFMRGKVVRASVRLDALKGRNHGNVELVSIGLTQTGRLLLKRCSSLHRCRRCSIQALSNLFVSYSSVRSSITLSLRLFESRKHQFSPQINTTTCFERLTGQRHASAIKSSRDQRNQSLRQYH